jgi:hypothetical protein
MPYKIGKVLLPVFLLISSATAQPSRWVEVGGNDEITAYVDTQSLRRNGLKVKVWLKWVNASPVDTDTIYPKKKYMSAKTLNIYHCTDRTLAGIQSIRYANADASGEVVETVSVAEARAEYTDLAPETIGESILVYVCKATSGTKQ